MTPEEHTRVRAYNAACIRLTSTRRPPVRACLCCGPKRDEAVEVRQYLHVEA